jgi:hypothetical protein
MIPVVITPGDVLVGELWLDSVDKSIHWHAMGINQCSEITLGRKYMLTSLWPVLSYTIPLTICIQRIHFLRRIIAVDRCISLSSIRATSRASWNMASRCPSKKACGLYGEEEPPCVVSEHSDILLLKTTVNLQGRTRSLQQQFMLPRDGKQPDAIAS